jgi:hypothetical protein
MRGGTVEKGRRMTPDQLARVEAMAHTGIGIELMCEQQDRAALVALLAERTALRGALDNIRGVVREMVCQRCFDTIGEPRRWRTATGHFGPVGAIGPYACAYCDALRAALAGGGE